MQNLTPIDAWKIHFSFPLWELEVQLGDQPTSHQSQTTHAVSCSFFSKRKAQEPTFRILKERNYFVEEKQRKRKHYLLEMEKDAGRESTVVLLKYIYVYKLIPVLT